MKKEESHFDYKKFKAEAISKLKTGKGFSGDANVLLPLIKDLLESAMSSELDIYLKENKSLGIANRRNGSTSKQMKTEHGTFELSSPRDRNSDFNPEIVEKHQTVLGEAFEANILSLYSKGLSYREIQNHLGSLYGTKISAGKLTEITDSILPELNKWKNRNLESVYSIIWLDAIHFNVRDNGVMAKKAVYTILGFDIHGQKEVLGMYIGQNESSKFWLSVLEDLQNRGVEDILIACMDNLSGFTEAIEAVFPKADVQLCIIHQIRNSMKYVVQRDKQAITQDLKTIYKAVNLSAAEIAMDNFEAKWKQQYPLIIKSWRNNWHHLTRYFDYSNQIRRIMYTTNTIESFNRQIRKYTKTKGSFSNDKALEKLLYVAMKSISEKWTQKPPYWGLAQQQMIIKFGDRCRIKY